MIVNPMGAKKTPIHANDPITVLIDRDLTLLDPEPAEMEKAWAELRAVYPKRLGGQNFPEAKKVFMDWVYNHGVDPRLIVDGAKGYAEEATRLGKVGTSYVPHLVTFIRKSRYLGYSDPETSDRSKRIAAVMGRIEGKS